MCTCQVKRRSGAGGCGGVGVRVGVCVSVNQACEPGGTHQHLVDTACMCLSSRCPVAPTLSCLRVRAQQVQQAPEFECTAPETDAAAAPEEEAGEPQLALGSCSGGGRSKLHWQHSACAPWAGLAACVQPLEWAMLSCSAQHFSASWGNCCCSTWASHGPHLRS